MVAYLVNRMIAGILAYETVVMRRPDLKDQLDRLLMQLGRQDIISPKVEP